MSSNTFGKIFRLTTWGESHGPAVGAIVDGCPAGIALSEEKIQIQMDRRRVGQSDITSPRGEPDKAEIMSGVFKGKTTGTPIMIMVHNKDSRSGSYENIKTSFRPGHADYTYTTKYGFYDYRGGGRASARETASRVAGGAVAKELLSSMGIDVFAHTVAISDIHAKTFDRTQIEKNDIRCADPVIAEKMKQRILDIMNEGDSLGGIIDVVALGVPAGLGEPIYGKLDAELAAGLMSINAVKGVEIGAGFTVAKMLGSKNNDSMYIKDGKPAFASNNSGGIDGGISNGNDIVARIAVKPTSSIAKQQNTINTKFEEIAIQVEGRHDPCICPRAVPVAEAMMCLVLADHVLRNRTSKI
ncbi:MAG TPA: chorismate synthase [Nitrospinota bacterium]|nr:chorismate synthase [Nitrospinota bacterium]|tara:strand:+ start:23177 stop:24244 length:1068 start_codon:yes stop_codon:yes gene_type:complete